MKHSPQFLKLVEEARAGVAETSVGEVMARIALGESFELIDVREESEFVAGHVKGARHIGKGVIERDIEEKLPDPNAHTREARGQPIRRAFPPSDRVSLNYRNSGPAIATPWATGAMFFGLLFLMAGNPTSNLYTGVSAVLAMLLAG